MRAQSKRHNSQLEISMWACSKTQVWKIPTIFLANRTTLTSIKYSKGKNIH